ncbi:MAG TPA: hypothetical protein PK349_01770 [Candidatus Hydrogenedentes bacterium]|nr:hypothetical protein [Candidatus Hydrogenedentota bacterium]
MAEKKTASLVGGIADRLNDLADRIKGKLPGDLVKDAAESLSALTKDTGKMAAAESLTAAQAVVRAQKKLAEQALGLLDTMSRVPEKVTDRLTAAKSALPPEAKTVLKEWTALTRETRKQFRKTLLDSFDQALSGLDRARKELKTGPAGKAEKKETMRPAGSKAAKSKTKPVAKSGKAAASAGKKPAKSAAAKKPTTSEGAGESGNG